MSQRSSAAVFAALALVACATEVRLEGRAVRRDGAPVASAVVELDCRKVGWGLHPALTDGTGHFLAKGLGCVPKSCDVRAVAPDGSTAVRKVAEHCAYSHWYCKAATCNEIRLEVSLPPPQSVTMPAARASSAECDGGPSGTTRTVR